MTSKIYRKVAKVFNIIISHFFYNFKFNSFNIYYFTDYYKSAWNL